MNGTRDRITAFGEKYLAQMKSLRGKPRVKAGILQRDANIPAESDGPTDATLLEVAIYNEFGTADGHVPERSFLRSTIAAKAGNWAGWMGEVEELKKQVNAGKLTVSQMLARIGMMMKRDIQAKIRSNVPPPNRPATKARKGSSATLIDKGQMLNAIDYQVEMVEKIV